MNRLLATVEVIAIALAAVLGVMWVRNPSGPYEPYAFMATLLGTTLTDIARRHIHSKEESAAWARAASEIIPSIVNVVKAEIERITKEQSSSNQQALQEVLNRLPEMLQVGMRDWQQVQNAKMPSSTSAVATLVKQVERTLSEVYGVDQSKVPVGETSLTDIRMRRKKLD